MQGDETQSRRPNEVFGDTTYAMVYDTRKVCAVYLGELSLQDPRQLLSQPRPDRRHVDNLLTSTSISVLTSTNFDLTLAGTVTLHAYASTATTVFRIPCPTYRTRSGMRRRGARRQKDKTLAPHMNTQVLLLLLSLFDYQGNT
jgi:hypothetical protein